MSLRNPLHNVCRTPEPRWPAVVSLLAVGGLYEALPRAISVGSMPRWSLLILVALLLVPTILTFRTDHHHLNQIFGFTVLGVVTVALVWSLYLLVISLPTHTLPPEALLRSAAALWATNVLVFAMWYWRLDAGGPHLRDLRPGHHEGSFLFPQMAMDAESRELTGQLHWSPQFVDYLFLAFNHSTALSPTDTAVLTRWAKVLVMVQAMVSLTTIALLAARAVNIL